MWRVSGVGGRAGAVEVAVAVRDDGGDLARSVRCGETGAEPACDESATDPGREDGCEVEFDGTVCVSFEFVARVDEGLDGGGVDLGAIININNDDRSAKAFPRS